MNTMYTRSPSTKTKFFISKKEKRKRKRITKRSLPVGQTEEYFTNSLHIL